MAPDTAPNGDEDRIPDTAARRGRYADRFCPECGIDLGLHGTDDPEPDDCRYAASKADLLTSMDRLFGVRR